MHFTPTSASWLNTVEHLLRDITYKRFRRDRSISLPELELAIDLYVAHLNTNSKAFIWTTGARGILVKATRAQAAQTAAAGKI